MIRRVSEGIAEAISETLNRYDLTDAEYEWMFNEAADVFESHIKQNTPISVMFNIETCMFLDSSALSITSELTESEQKDLLRRAEAAADEWITANL